MDIPVSPTSGTAEKLQTGELVAPLAMTETLVQEELPAARKRWWKRMSSRMSKASSNVGGKFRALRRRRLDQDALDEILEILLGADVGLTTAEALIDELAIWVKKEHISDMDIAIERLQRLMVERLSRLDRTVHYGPEGSPSVYMVVGVNGNGKTTSIGKMSYILRSMGRSSIIAAADTFRAAAREQLEVWAHRTGAGLVAHAPNADPGAVVYDAISAALARGVDTVLIDTAGRLHTKGQLMQELSKIAKVTSAKLPGAPHETLLVLEAVTGMNAVVQVREFAKALPLTGIILTKLDGTSKGGMVFAIEEELQVPVKLIGLGEGMEDMNLFDPVGYCANLFDTDEDDAQDGETR